MSDVDADGSVYVAGQYTGELSVESANDTTQPLVAYCSEHWKKTFVTKYSAEGQVEYMIQIKSAGSNSYFASPRKFKCLNNGDWAILVYANYPFKVWTPFGEHKIKNGHELRLLRFSAKGELLWDKALRGDKSGFMLEDEQSNLYVASNARLVEGASPVFKYNEQGGAIDTIFLGRYSASRGFYVDSKIWYTTYKYLKKKNTYDHTSEITFHKIDLRSNTVTQQFVLPIDKSSHYQFDISKFRDKIEINLFMEVNYNGYEYMNKVYQNDKQNVLLKLDENGKVKRHKYFDIPARSVSTFASDNDGSIFLTCSKDTLNLKGMPQVVSPKHTRNMQEVYLIKLNNSFQVEWHLGCGSGRPLRYIMFHQDYTYFISNLGDFGTFAGEYKELKWNSGYYLMKLH